jgi:hypothetical protein
MKIIFENKCLKKYYLNIKMHIGTQQSAYMNLESPSLTLHMYVLTIS